jgi:hypothetical protein
MKHVVNFILILLLLFVFKSNIQAQEQLFAPNLITPEHKLDCSTIPEKFVWNSVNGAKHYFIQITTDVTFLNIDSNSSIIIPNHNDTIYIPVPNKILIDTMYFWRVKAIGDTTESEWSFIRMFMTGYTSINNDNKMMQIIPVPIENYAKIILDNNYDDLECFIFTNTGILIDKQTFSMINNIIDFTQYYTGTYYVVITSKNKIIGNKSIIVK